MDDVNHPVRVRVDLPYPFGLAQGASYGCSWPFHDRPRKRSWIPPVTSVRYLDGALSRPPGRLAGCGRPASGTFTATLRAAAPAAFRAFSHRIILHVKPYVRLVRPHAAVDA